MRGFLTACAVLAANQAVAAPWADWVGDYKGALTWRQCTAPGEKSPAIAVDGVDGTLRIDLKAAGAALRALSLVQDDQGWTGQDGDVSVHLERKKPNTIELAIDIESGCTVRGKIARVTTGVTACDRLIGWARIEDKCSSVTTALEDFSALAKQKFKKADAAKCTARADKLELAMIDKGCAPHPDPNIGTRAAECRSLVDATNKLARCGRVPKEIMDRLSGRANALNAASQSAEPSTLKYVERQCKDAQVDVTGTATQFSCQL